MSGTGTGFPPRRSSWKWVVGIGAAMLLQAGAVACLGPKDQTVPDLHGKSQSEATQMLSEQHLRLLTSSEVVSGAEPATVVDQNPPAGSTLVQGGTVTVIMEATRAAVPDLTGKAETQVAAILAQQGLKLGSLTRDASRLDPPTGSAGSVFEQDPSPGQVLDARSTVNVSVETGVHSTGRVALTFTPSSSAVSLDTGDFTDLGGADLFLAVDSSCNDCMVIQAMSSVPLADVGRNFVGLAGCQKALATSARSSLPLTVRSPTGKADQTGLVGEYICARTKQGRIAEFTQEDAKDSLVFHYTTWESANPVRPTLPQVPPVIRRP